MFEPSVESDLAAELAQLAARHIAEEGLSYAQAKRKAAKQCGVAEHTAAMPSNPAVEQALREYQTQFQADTQPQALLALRQLALRWMGRLARLEGLERPCSVWAVGAVVNGTAGEHSPVRLDVYTDELKHFEMALLNAGHSLEYSEASRDAPVLVAQDQGVPIVMTVKHSPQAPANKALAAHGVAQTANAVQLNALIERMM
jgi:hypothetical protein